MRFIIVLFLSLICNLSLFSQNNEYKDQIGEMFYQLGLKTKLKKVDVKDVYNIYSAIGRGNLTDDDLLSSIGLEDEWSAYQNSNIDNPYKSFSEVLS